MLPFAVVTIIALAVVLYTVWRDATNRAPTPIPAPLLIAAAVAKTIASAAFLGAAVALGAFESVFGQALFIALVWSFIGDVLLIFVGSRIAFMIGIAAFLMAHIGYIMVFRMRGVDMTAVLIAAVPMALVGYLIWRWLSPKIQGGMRIAVGFYITVITLMVAFAIGTYALIPIVAATLFWLSDITVARQRFATRSFWNRAIGLPLYYAAQYVFIALLT